MTLKEFCRLHGLHLERGSRVRCGSRLGTVTGTAGLLIRVRFDGNQISSPCDPLEIQPLNQGTSGASQAIHQGAVGSA